jgi:hypothetical protein
VTTHSNNGHITLTDESEKENENGLRAYETLGNFLINDEWHPQPIEGKYAYRTFLSGDFGELRCEALIRVEQEQFTFYICLGTNVPADRRADAAEFLTRANYGLPLGNFEMDFEDGEVRFKNSICFVGEALTDNLIRNTIYPAGSIATTYFPGLLKVVFGSANPRDVIQEIES